MPNYCSNHLVIKGEQKELDRFKKNANSVHGKFLENLYPMPNSIDISNSSIQQNGMMPDWYNWRVQHWGTKWDIDVDLVSETDKQLVYNFDSAWSPPVDGFLHISSDYPSLIFDIKFEENGSDFIGYSVFQNGKILEQAEAQYSVQAAYDFKFEKASIENDFLELTILISYKKDKWNFESTEKSHHLIQVQAQSTNGYSNFDDAESWKFDIKNAENITHDDFNDYFKDNLSYYIQENQELIKALIEKEILERQTEVSNKNGEITLKI